MNTKSTKKSSGRKPPIHVPLTFDELASNIFKVDPAKLPKKVRPGASKAKPAPKKKARKK